MMCGTEAMGWTQTQTTHAKANLMECDPDPRPSALLALVTFDSGSSLADETIVDAKRGASKSTGLRRKRTSLAAVALKTL